LLGTGELHFARELRFHHGGAGAQMASNDTVLLRPVEATDRDAVVALLATSLRRGDDPRFDLLFAWKHEQNAFGPSVQIVAVDGEAIVGFRAFMRWRFEHRGRVLEAARAVDTATHPDYQGRGIFTRLTLRALELLHDEGVSFVFNTPNEQSRPGYLKMGWRMVGRPPIAVRPRSLMSAVRMAQSRAPAERWSEPSDVGADAAQFLHGEARVIDALLSSQPAARGLRTVRSPEYLSWRYGPEFLAYRVLPAAQGAEHGVVIFRVRRRGAAREVVLDEVLVPDGDRRVATTLVKALAKRTSADSVIRIDGRALSADGFFRLPRQGPILTWRAVCDAHMPALADWDLTMGDVELF
jgi:GNAT superfamily N-acetyltransferase